MIAFVQLLSRFELEVYLSCIVQESLLYPKLDPGRQRVDQCVVDKLTR